MIELNRKRREILDDVRGQIVGRYMVPYEFVVKDGLDIPGGPYERTLYRGHFESDESAIGFISSRFPDEFKKGIKMKVFDI
jgi:hypothetical protein